MAAQQQSKPFDMCFTSSLIFGDDIAWNFKDFMKIKYQQAYLVATLGQCQHRRHCKTAFSIFIADFMRSFALIMKISWVSPYKHCHPEQNVSLGITSLKWHARLLPNWNSDATIHSPLGEIIQQGLFLAIWMASDFSSKEISKSSKAK